MGGGDTDFHIIYSLPKLYIKLTLDQGRELKYTVKLNCIFSTHKGVHKSYTCTETQVSVIFI